MALIPPEELFRGPGCPLCRERADGERRYLMWFFLENYYSEPTLQLLATAPFCPRHARILAEGHHPELSATFSWLLRWEEQDLSLRRDRRRRWWELTRLRQRRDPPPWQGCPVCAAGDISAGALALEVAEALRREQYRLAYRTSDGLCRIHLREVLARADPSAATYLIEETIRRISLVQQELACYFHKLDYRYSHEPKGEEQQAWRHALSYFWPHFPPHSAKYAGLPAVPERTPDA